MNLLNRIAHKVLKELIDTLWNVNLSSPDELRKIEELIDTLWNVNSEEGEYKLISGEN